MIISLHVRALMIVALVAVLAGCHFTPKPFPTDPVAARNYCARIEGNPMFVSQGDLERCHQIEVEATCRLDGIMPDSPRWADCLTVTEGSIRRSEQLDRARRDEAYQLFRTQQQMRQLQQQQILQQGYGVCTPNFATGGCL